MLEVRGLAKVWPDFRLGLSLSLGKGEIVAILGPSGCGKSTTLRLIAGLERPDEGRVIVGDRDVTGLPPERRGIGMVFQDLALFPHLSVKRNIEYGPRMRGEGRKRREEIASELAAAFEIDRLLGRRPDSLSGGERQRVALARALAARPQIVLLDEPLSSLDASLRKRLRSEIASGLRRADMTAILVTHDAEEAFAIADRVVLMRDGRIEAEGEPEKLYEEPPTAWSAAFLGRGTVLEILESEGGEQSPVVATALGSFRCVERRPESAEDSGGASLFFPSDAPRLRVKTADSAAAPLQNGLHGRVLSSYFAGRSRRIALACPIQRGPDRGGEIILELELPPSARPAVGEKLELEVPEESCFALPGRSC
jgi:ABC-type Fe3+/spermidine/putrescine transport system ATPase subunit